MARRKPLADRPLDYLARAAEAHARIESGESETPESSEAAEPETEPSAHSKSARRQRRSTGGKFV